MSEPGRELNATASDAAQQLRGQDLLDAGGERIGKINQVFLDDETGQPEWVTVTTGLFGTHESFVPVAPGHISGSDLGVPYGKDMVMNAPTVDDESGHLSPKEEAELYRYYGMTPPEHTETRATDRSIVRQDFDTTHVQQGRARILLTDPALVERRKALVEKAQRKMSERGS